jgi:hypothetical protein
MDAMKRARYSGSVLEARQVLSLAALANAKGDRDPTRLYIEHDFPSLISLLLLPESQSESLIVRSQDQFR